MQFRYPPLRFRSLHKAPKPPSLSVLSGKKRAHKLKKNPRDTGRVSLGHPAGKQGSTGRCPRDFLLFTIEKRTGKGIFAGTPAGCPRDTRPSRRFSETLCDFLLGAFSAPYFEGKACFFFVYLSEKTILSEARGVTKT